MSSFNNLPIVTAPALADSAFCSAGTQGAMPVGAEYQTLLSYLQKLFQTGAFSGSAQTAAYVGEIITGNVVKGSAVSLTTGTPANLLTLSLTKGNWAVQGNIFITGSGSLQPLKGSLSTTSATDAAFPNYSLTNLTPTTSDVSFLTPVTYFNFSVTTNVYVVVNAAFPGGGTMAAYGAATAIRTF